MGSGVEGGRRRGGARRRARGTIDVLAGLQWLQSKGYVASDATLSQVNFGWEICSTGGVAETFEMTSYLLAATAK